jgi:hypothetical protein
MKNAFTAIRDSRKYFLTFIVLIVLIIGYLRIDSTIEISSERQDFFIKFGWIVMGTAGAYIGAQALQNGLQGPYDSGGVDITINKSLQDIPQDK